MQSAPISATGVWSILIRDLDVAGAETVHLVLERALQHQGQLRPGMAVVGHGRAGGDVEQPRRGIPAVGRMACFTPMPTGRQRTASRSPPT